MEPKINAKTGHLGSTLPKSPQGPPKGPQGPPRAPQGLHFRAFWSLLGSLLPLKWHLKATLTPKMDPLADTYT